MTFKELGLKDEMLRSLRDLNHNTPTPIQTLAIPHIMNKKDILGCAQTGTGKTGAFVLPIIHSLMTTENNNYYKIKVLILSPTRELAMQTRDNFRKYAAYTNLRCAVVLGGVNQRSQENVLRKGIDVLVATPGRLLDLINKRIVKLNSVNTLVLDEADTMLDMGFIHDIKKIVSYVPEERQTLMFSATMPKTIRNLAKEFLKNPIVLETNSTSLTVDKINQSVYFVDSRNKVKLLLEILRSDEMASTLIFTRTKHGANRLATTLSNNNIHNEVIHGNKSQNSRVLALNNFKSGRSKILVATDIAARGIDVAELSRVINYELPNIAESYVHRIGRTGRAGCGGIAISFCDQKEKRYLNDINRLINQSVTVVENHNYPMEQLAGMKPDNKGYLASNKNSNKQSKSEKKFNHKTRPYKKWINSEVMLQGKV